MSPARTLGVIGAGLIGGSIALAARANGLRVAGFDSDMQAARDARAAGILDEIVDREGVYARSNIVVIATPVRAAVAELEMLDPAALRGVSLVIDVASVKAPIAQASRGLPHFVATHPMAGSHESGPGAADARLFEGKTWAYVPSGDSALDGRATEFIASCGARPLPVDAEAHDAAVAFTSHMPQVLAWLFAARLQERGDDGARSLCGPVARELLRISASNAQMWQDVLEYNARNVARELSLMAKALGEAAESSYMRKTP